MMKVFLISLFVSLGALAKPQLAKSFRPWWAENLLYYETFHTVGNYDSNGSLTSLPSSNSFWEFSAIDDSGRYTFNNNWAMTAGINYVRAQTTIGNNTSFNGGLQTLRGGLEYRFDIDFADFIVEGVGQYSIFQVDSSTTAPLYGDGAHGLGGNLWFIKKLGGFLLQGKAGYLYRTQGLSSLIPYQIGFFWRPGNWSLGALVDGFISSQADQESERFRNSFLAKTNAQSLYFRSANPNSNFLDLQAKWNPTSQFSVYGGVGKNFMGRNSSEGTRIFIGFDLVWQVFQPKIEKSPMKNIIPVTPKPHKTQHQEENTPLFQEEDYQKELPEQGY